ncbi:MAG: FprA family A-type flavoprotein [bacterium]|nr:FprA family A-type flavoprotein [bacterium]
MVQPIQIQSNLYWVGAFNPELRWFDVVLYTPHGTTYNSYLILDEKVALIELVHAKFTDTLIDNITSIIELSKLDYIIVNHTEMDHTGALSQLLELAPNVQVVSTKTAANFLKKIVNRDFHSLPVTDQSILDLGQKKLRFISVPYWHWPDTMFTYLVEDAILFSCDGFGCHFCDERLFNDTVANFDDDFKYYYDHIMRPFKPKIAAGISKIAGLDITMICPSHGPILRSNPEKYIQLYTDWTKEVPPSAKKRIAIFYVSAYGNTRNMAEVIAAEINQSGTIEAKLINAKEAEVELLRNELESADGFLFGSPTFMGDAVKPIWDIISLLPTVAVRGKPVAVFGSFGWSGEAIHLLEDRLKGLKMNITLPGLKIHFVPNRTELEQCRDFAKAFIASL